MTRLLVAAGLLALAIPASAQIVRSERAEPEQMISTRNLVGAVSATAYNGTAIPGDRAMLVTYVRTRVTSAAVGAGSVVWLITDGTNNCTCTGNCETAGVAGYVDNGNKAIPCTGACTFAPGAQITLSASTASCANTRPTITTIDLWARPQ